MQKNIIVAALALCGAGAAMAQTAPASKVELWGIVDAAVRHTKNEGVDQKSKNQMVIVIQFFSLRSTNSNR